MNMRVNSVMASVEGWGLVSGRCSRQIMGWILSVFDITYHGEIKRFSNQKSAGYGATPVICGTPVPVAPLFDYLMDGLTIEEFLHHFATVNKLDALIILDHTRIETLETAAG